MNDHEYEEYMDILRHMEEIPVEPPESFIDDYEEYYEPDLFPEPPDADYVNLHETRTSDRSLQQCPMGLCKWCHTNAE